MGDHILLNHLPVYVKSRRNGTGVIGQIQRKEFDLNHGTLLFQWCFNPLCMLHYVPISIPKTLTKM